MNNQIDPDYDSLSESEADYLAYLSNYKIDDGSYDYQYDEYNYDYYYDFYFNLENGYSVIE